MREQDLRQRIEDALGELADLVKNSPPLPVGDWELALELGEDEKTGRRYLFVLLCSPCYSLPVLAASFRP